MSNLPDSIYRQMVSPHAHVPSNHHRRTDNFGVRRKSQSSCLANLREIGWAKAMLASDQKLTNDAAVTKEQLLPYVREWPQCPQGGQYSPAKMGESPKCSYSAHSHYEECGLIARSTAAPETAATLVTR